MPGDHTRDPSHSSTLVDCRAKPYAKNMRELRSPSEALRFSGRDDARPVTSACIRAGMPPWKRLLDLFAIVITAPVWLPVMLLIAIFIKIVSRGPVLFQQERIGHLARPFTCFKFRTMQVNADTQSHSRHLTRLMESNEPMKKLDSAGDPRLIPGAWLIRATGLDELPQLFNVLRGEMSLVGPRPCVRYEYEAYSAHHARRLESVPGLTGLWQVSGKNRTTFDEMIDLDIRYAREKSLALDLKIIFKTIPALVLQTKDVSEERKPANGKTATSQL